MGAKLTKDVRFELEQFDGHMLAKRVDPQIRADFIRQGLVRETLGGQGKLTMMGRLALMKR